MYWPSIWHHAPYWNSMGTVPIILHNFSIIVSAFVPLTYIPRELFLKPPPATPLSQPSRSSPGTSKLWSLPCAATKNVPTVYSEGHLFSCQIPPGSGIPKVRDRVLVRGKEVRSPPPRDPCKSIYFNGSWHFIHRQSPCVSSALCQVAPPFLENQLQTPLLENGRINLQLLCPPMASSLITA
ncbi:hypothetical protein K402DRAFT_17828 [Aulographum hederae CBS 113979]|uniref:Uncharacterized protein n=1 Tax=Aulographum hederae CBS 113979 TaxID=1176131 RepID=A0A6G1H6Q0_9PEZI|nr:hypothetical protein K402DRAFT_17828 [Aulographum hederae CBS 113979]